MNIYHFDRASRRFLSIGKADASQTEPGKFDLPAFATAIAPPTAPPGSVAVFNYEANVWSIVDVRNEAEPAPVAATFAQKVASWRKFTTSYANLQAIDQGFDSMDEAVTYAGEPSVPLYQVQGMVLRAWRSVLWLAFEQVVIDIERGAKPEPKTSGELVGMLPAFTAPDTTPQGIKDYLAEWAVQ